MLILTRAAFFTLLLAVSAVLSPLLAYALSAVLTTYLTNFLFFWPQHMLLPYGLVSYEVGHSDLLFMDSAILGAIAFWSLVSLAYGYFLRNVIIVYVALGAYPAAVVAMFLFHWVLGIFGYGVYVDGP